MGNTPLHQASFFGRIDCAGLLVEAGADVNAKNSIGAIPFSRTNEGTAHRLCHASQARIGRMMTCISPYEQT